MTELSRMKQCDKEAVWAVHLTSPDQDAESYLCDEHFDFVSPRILSTLEQHGDVVRIFVRKI